MARKHKEEKGHFLWDSQIILDWSSKPIRKVAHYGYNSLSFLLLFRANVRGMPGNPTESKPAVQENSVKT